MNEQYYETTSKTPVRFHLFCYGIVFALLLAPMLGYGLFYWLRKKFALNN